MTEKLEPLDTRTGKEMYLDHRRAELADRTLKSHHYRLEQFLEYLDAMGIDNLNDLTSRDLHRYRVKRREEDGLALDSIRGQMFTIKKFTEFLASIDAVRSGLSEDMLIPKTTGVVRDDVVEPETSTAILDYLRKFRYARVEHAFLQLLWHTGIRIGAAVGRDVDDYSRETRSMQIEHRPEYDCPLKNGKSGERVVALSEQVCEVIDDYLAEHHHGKEDEYGRDPLFTTPYGRLSRQRARGIAYQYTRPCAYLDECPHDRDQETCEAGDAAYASKCPSSMSPHSWRRGSITYHLLEKTPKQVVQDRVDASGRVIDRFYDKRNHYEKMETRRDHLPDE